MNLPRRTASLTAALGAALALTVGCGNVRASATRVDAAARPPGGQVLDLSASGSDSIASPAVAIGADGRTVVVWISQSNGGYTQRIEVRSGPSPSRLGPVQTLSPRASIGLLEAADPIATVGPDGTAAVAWISPGPPHNTRIFASVAGPGGRFGSGRDVDRNDAAELLNGIGVDRSDRVVVSWDDFGGGCCADTGVARYAIGSRTHAFTTPRTLPLQGQEAGYGQVLQTAGGGLVLAAPAGLYELASNGSGLTALPVPPSGTVRYAAGPSGIAASILEMPARGPASGTDIGTALLPAGGAWTAPTFVPRPSGAPEPYPDPAVAADGTVALTGGLKNQVVLSTTTSAGTLSPPQQLGPIGFVAVVPTIFNPRVVAFGTSTAVTWVTGDYPHAAVHLATTTPGSRPRIRVLGSAAEQSGPGEGSNASTAAVAWVGDGHTWLWYARS